MFSIPLYAAWVRIFLVNFALVGKTSFPSCPANIVAVCIFLASVSATKPKIPRERVLSSSSSIYLFCKFFTESS